MYVNINIQFANFLKKKNEVHLHKLNGLAFASGEAVFIKFCYQNYVNR